MRLDELKFEPREPGGQHWWECTFMPTQAGNTLYVERQVRLDTYMDFPQWCLGIYLGHVDKADMHKQRFAEAYNAPDVFTAQCLLYELLKR